MKQKACLSLGHPPLNINPRHVLYHRWQRVHNIQHFSSNLRTISNEVQISWKPFRKLLMTMGIHYVQSISNLLE